MNILLPVDGSEAALAAARQVVQMLGDGLRAHVVLANVQETASLYELVTAHDAQVIERVSAGAAVDALAPAQALLVAAGADYEAEVALGDPARMLLEIAERFNCTLIVMGAQGVGEPQRRAHLGSVATAVLHGASAAVTIVRQRPASP
ncbi:MAG TPA: universal stress protein [Burkholderiaceae bacterium]|jgi:nucleotide-binding universal stress UspA family protein